MERVELHLHTNMSQMDGINCITDYIDKAKEFGMTSLAITDHGVVQSFPEAQNYLERINDNEFKIIYGMEGYCAYSKDEKARTYHTSILVKNRTGLKNLYKLISISNLKHFYKKPRILREILDENREGLLIGSACNMGELYQAIIENKTDEEVKQITSYYDYLEIQPIGNNYDLIKQGIVKDEKALQDINIKIVELGIKLNKLVVATSDVHFLNKEDEIYRRILQAGQGYEEADNQPLLYFRTTEEMLKEFEYLGQDKAYEVVVTNTNKIADTCENIKPISNEKCYPHFENSKIELKELAYKGAYRIYGDPLPIEVQERLDKELNSIIENDFATLYMIAQKLVKKSNEDGYIVGSRGSAASSLVAYCIGITEVDPIKYKIPFETFAGFNGDKEPDFDLNFAGEYQQKIQEYVKEILDGGTTVKAGSIGTITDKTAYEYVKKYYEDRNMQVDNEKIERLAQGLTGIKRTTGHYPGGIIVVPKGKEIYEFCPVQHPADDPKSDIITTHFDYHSIWYNLLKLDILGHGDPTMLYKLQELTGINPTTIPLDDTKTMEMMCSADTFGIPEFDTKFVKNMILETKPTTFDELIKISGLSHGTNVWLDNAQELIESGTATLKEVIACRDDIMNYLIEVGIEPKMAFDIMETIRRGRVRRNREEHWEEYKEIMKQHNVPDWYIKSCEKINYMFPKAHATSYVINAFRIAYYKVHYPHEFYTTIKKKENKMEEAFKKSNNGIIGLAIGDSLGVPVEFKSREELKINPITDMEEDGTYNTPKGCWSDDTSMTLATMDSIINNKTINTNDIADRFLKWFRNAEYTATEKVFDIGRTTLQALAKYELKLDEASACGVNCEYDNGNGSLMRMLPLAYYIYNNKIVDDKKIYDLVRDVSSITHSHPISVLGCYIYVRFVLELLNNNDKFQAYKNIQKLDYSYFYDYAISKYYRILERNIQELKEEDISSSGYVVSTLEATIWIFLNSNDYNNTILKAINLGNDTDTIGACTGGLLGIYYGIENIKLKWKNDLLKYDYIMNLCNKFNELYEE